MKYTEAGDIGVLDRMTVLDASAEAATNSCVASVLARSSIGKKSGTNVGIDDVVEERHEQPLNPEAHQNTGEQRGPVADAGVRRPPAPAPLAHAHPLPRAPDAPKPEEIHSEADRAPARHVEAVLGRDGVRRELVHEVVVLRRVVVEVADDAERAADRDREEHEPGRARVEVVALCEHDWERLEAEVDASVNELVQGLGVSGATRWEKGWTHGEVERDGDKHGLGEHDTERPDQDMLDTLQRAECGAVHRSVVLIITSLLALRFRFRDEQDRPRRQLI